jgi:hypothetical protein
VWAGLPDPAQAQLLSLFARLIARTPIIDEVKESR